MKAKVIKPFRGAKDGEHHPVDFKVGDIVEGKLAAVAVAEKWAEAEAPRRRGAAAQDPAGEASTQEPSEAPAQELAQEGANEPSAS